MGLFHLFLAEFQRNQKVFFCFFELAQTCESLAKEGVKIPRPPGPMKHGGSVIAFIEDPDGYKIELIERK